MNKDVMSKDEFKKYRKKLDKTQKQMAELLGVSLKAVHSYEQGWRRIPVHVERQIYFLLSRLARKNKATHSCWIVKKCSREQKLSCPAWEFSTGDLCWFINGTVCEGRVQKNWKEKMKICRTCEVFANIF
jgi:DNA-binding XRE family transcriptional regulator